jgi:hypothetical protein
MKRLLALALILAPLQAVLFPAVARGQASLSLNTPTTGSGTITVSGSFTLDSGYKLTGSAITVYILSSDGTTACATAPTSTNFTCCSCGTTFTTQPITVQNGDYTVYATMEESLCGGASTFVNSSSQSATVAGGKGANVPGTVTIDKNKTTGGVNKFTVAVNWTTNAGFTFDKNVQIILINSAGAPCYPASISPDACANGTVLNSNGKITPGTYLAYAIVRYKDGNNVVFYANSTPGFEIKVTDK